MITVFQGEDKIFTLKVRNEKGDPVDLTEVSDIKVQLAKSIGNFLELSSSNITPAKHATYVAETFTLIAVTSGVEGNSISLSFDGVTSLEDTVIAWNAANPTSQIAIQEGDPTQIPSISTINLSGGENEYWQVQVQDPAVLGLVQVYLTDRDTQQLQTGEINLLLTLDFGTHQAGMRRMVKLQRALDVQHYR